MTQKRILIWFLLLTSFALAQTQNSTMPVFANPAIHGQGTPNVVSKFTSRHSIGNSVIVQSPDGSVGISTRTPAAPLDVLSNINFGPTLQVQNSNAAGDVAIDFQSAGLFAGNMGLAGVGAATVLATTALAQSAKNVRGPTPYVEIQNEPAPKLIVDPPIPEGLAIGLFWAQYRVENVRIQQVFGAGALKVSPRVGHLHIQVDDAPFLWADASDNNTVDVAFFTPGQHKVKIDLVDPNHNVFPGQSVTPKFTILKGVGEAAHAEQHAPTK